MAAEPDRAFEGVTIQRHTMGTTADHRSHQSVVRDAPGFVIVTAHHRRLSGHQIERDGLIVIVTAGQVRQCRDQRLGVLGMKLQDRGRERLRDHRFDVGEPTRCVDGQEQRPPTGLDHQVMVGPAQTKFRFFGQFRRSEDGNRRDQHVVREWESKARMPVRGDRVGGEDGSGSTPELHPVDGEAVRLPATAATRFVQRQSKLTGHRRDGFGHRGQTVPRFQFLDLHLMRAG